MPTYEFLCNTTGKRFEVTFKSIDDYSAAEITSPYTGSTDVTRIIDRVGVMRGGVNFEALMNGDEQAIQAMEDADPQTMGRALRALAEETGEDMGSEFHDVVSRLEAGQSPDQIDAALPPPAQPEF
jgi:predicted nucleic acid-binding Zn ribbon protein